MPSRIRSLERIGSSPTSATGSRRLSLILPVHARTISVAGFSGSPRRSIMPFVTMCNLANLNAAMRGGLLDLIEVELLAVGAGPTLDFAHATAFLAEFETIIEKVRRRRLQ
jgi:hypothetical protein